MAKRKRYGVVGTGGRSIMFLWALAKDYADAYELAAMCDINPARMAYYADKFADELDLHGIPTYGCDEFEKMIREQKLDAVVVTTVDRLHHRYICRAMELGCDVITEKPMTVDAEKCQQILDTIARTGKQLRVTFNYRYAPRNSKVKELLQSGAIGRVLSTHFEWLLDTNHGADYFRRWHRDKRNSGGLMVHKATHHFDLMNWWLASVPQTVFGMGDLKFYGRENAEQRGETKFYYRATGSENAKDCPFALHLDKDENHRAMYLEAEAHDGYLRDQSVFGDGISIEDDMAVMVRFQNQATMSYHLTAYSPWEGYNVAFNGTRGRLEYCVEERSYISGDADDHNQPVDPSWHAVDIKEPTKILIRPHWGKPYEVEIDDSNEGGHGGGDKRLLDDIFLGAGDDPLGRAADHVSGAWSILTGIAANKSFATGLPIRADQLVTGLGLPDYPPSATNDLRGERPAG